MQFIIKNYTNKTFLIGIHSIITIIKITIEIKKKMLRPFILKYILLNKLNTFAQKKY